MRLIVMEKDMRKPRLNEFYRHLEESDISSPFVVEICQRKDERL